MLRTFFRLLLVFALLAPGALAQQSQRQPSQPATQPTPAKSPQAAPTPRADDGEPSVERLRAHVAYLASDKLEGRKTGTEGAEAAAAYVAREFAAAGLKTAPPTPSGAFEGRMDMGYLRSFAYVAGVEPGGGNAMTFTTREGERAATLDLRLREDWMPLGFTANGTVENAPAVFVGHGVVASELKYDDYAGADVKDKIAVALAAAPGGDNPHNPVARHNELRLKAAAARDRGARALVLVAREEKFADERLARLRYDNTGDAGLPVVVVSRAAARRVLEAGGVNLDDFEKRMRSAPPAGSVTAANNSSPHGAAAHPAFNAPLRNVTLTVKTDVVRRTVPGFNAVGVLGGSDAKLKEEVVVVGAHYDHLGRGGAGSLAAREGDIHYGADDNASGTAALVELARLLARERPRRTHVFIAFGGEEEGLLGSNRYVNQPVFPLERTVAMLNLDMVGRMRDNRLFVGGVGTAAEWRGWLARANEDLNMRVTSGTDGASASGGEIPVVRGANGQVVATAAPRERLALTLNEDGYGPSDHSSFYARKIPVLFFFTGTHADYHKPTDTADRLNYEGTARVVRLVRDTLRALDRSDRRPTYAATSSPAAGRAAGFRVYLGTVPTYADSTDGLVLDAVRDDSPASRAGLRAGDRITKLAGRSVRNVYDYTYALSEMQAGREYEVEFVRDGRTQQVKITPAARR